MRRLAASLGFIFGFQPLDLHPLPDHTDKSVSLKQDQPQMTLSEEKLRLRLRLKKKKNGRNDEELCSSPKK